MAYFYRLVILALVFFAAPAFASFPASMTTTPDRLAAFQDQISAGATNCGYGFTVYCRTIGPCTATAQAGQMCLFDGNGGAIDSGPGLLSCPSLSTLAGSTCTCTAPAVDNAAGNACVSAPPPPPPPNPCEAGKTLATTSNTPWVSQGDLVGAFQSMSSTMNSPGCMSPAGNGTGPLGCTVAYSMGASPMENKGVSGHSNYTFYLNGKTDGSTCGTAAPPPGVGPEPPCAGQSGQIDGKTVCLAAESESAKAERIASAAAAAAQAASAAASAAGASAAAAAAAAAAAGSTMAKQLKAGASGPVAYAAAVAAGAAAAAASTAGSTPAEAKTTGDTAGVVEAAGQRAQLIAQSAGVSGTIIQQAVSAARDAAAKAAAGVLVNGGTQAQADAAGRMAGQTATAIVLTGGSSAAAAAAGAAAGNGAAAGSANSPGGSGTDKPNDPVGDFCKTHPQAKMCKTEFEGEFSGACGAPPMCRGDAVLCAVAAATFATNCALSDPKASTPLYDAAVLKTGDQTSALAGNSTVNVSNSQFDQTELLGGAAGMSDRSITVMNSTFTLPFSSVNLLLSRLGIILQAVTFLLCARVVVRG